MCVDRVFEKLRISAAASRLPNDEHFDLLQRMKVDPIIESREESNETQTY
jgi:hypothetical protein